MAPRALADAPQRATTSMTLAFGLLNIQLSVYTGTETTRVDRKEFTMDGEVAIPVGRSPIRKDTGEVIDSADVVRKAEADNGVWVDLSDEEIASCTAPKGVAEVICFVKNKEVDQYLTETVYQVRPKATKGRVDPAANRAFALLLTVMADAKAHALVKVALRGPARYALLDNKGNLFFIYTADAIRTWRDLPVNEEFSEAELKVAKQLVEAVGFDTPTLTDTTAPVVKQYVNDKAAGLPAPVAPTIPAIPLDIMAQLEASLNAEKAKKGVA